MQKPSVNHSSNLVKIGEASKILGVSIDTLRRWEKAGKIKAIRTPGGTRLYSLEHLKEVNPQAVENHQAASFSTEELLKKVQNDSERLRKPEYQNQVELGQNIRVSDSLIIRSSDLSGTLSSSEFSGNKSSGKKKSFFTNFLLGSAFILTLTLILTSWIAASYLTNPKETAQFFQNNIASGILSPFHFLAEETVLVIDPQKAHELGFSHPEPPNPVIPSPEGEGSLANASTPGTSPGILRFAQNDKQNVLAVTSTFPYLEVNADTQILGSLYVRDNINNLKLEATPSANSLVLSSGTTSLTVTKSAKLDQDVSTTSSPTFNTLNLSGTSNQLIFQSGNPTGTLTWTPTTARVITLPDATTTLVGLDTTQTLKNKSLSGSDNTFTSIPNSALSNNKITVTAGTNLSGGGDVNLGSSITLSLKDSPSITGTLTVAGATTLSSTLAVTGTSTLTGAATVGSTLGVTGATTLSSTLAVAGTTTAQNIVPSTTSTYDLGSSSVSWRNIYTDAISIATTTISGQVLLPDGTAAAPALTFTADTDSGLWRVGDNLIALTTGGSAVSGLAINAGNVGIGTTSPNYNLDVVGTANISGNLGIGTSLTVTSALVGAGANFSGPLSAANLNVSSTSTFGDNLTLSSGQFLAPNGTASLPSYSFSNLTNAGLWTNGDGLLLTTGGTNTSGITVTGAGNVGIGTTTPSQTFQINPSGTSAFVVNSNGNVGIGWTSPTYKFQLAANGMVTSTNALYFGNTNNYMNWNSGDYLNLRGFQLVSISEGHGSVASFGATFEFKPVTYGSFFSSGNVGVGAVTAATSKFAVSGNASIGTGYYGSIAPTNGLIVEGNVGIGTSIPGSKLSVIGNVGIGTSAAGANLDVSGNGVFGWGTASVAGPTNGLGISGNVGIGTTTSNSNLSVSGNAHIGSLYQSIVAPTDGLFVDGNVGIGATTSTNMLDVWGNTRLAGNLTVDGTLTQGGNLTLSSGQFLAPNGTASLPSYSFSNLTNAGLWTNGDGLLLTTNGTNTSGITVTAAGNVGIGTTSPGSALTVIGNVGIGTSAAGAALQVNGGGLFGWGTSSTSLSLGAIAGFNGNVGVGTTTPLANLHVVGQCVAEGTRIRRRRRKVRKDSEKLGGPDPSDNQNTKTSDNSDSLTLRSSDNLSPSEFSEYIEEDIPVEQILPGDEVLSLNDKTGEWEWHQVEAALNKGVQEVYRLETGSGKWIETTSEHPYLVNHQKTTLADGFIASVVGKPTIIPLVVLSTLYHKMVNLSSQKKEYLRGPDGIRTRSHYLGGRWSTVSLPAQVTEALSLSQITTKWVKVSQLKKGVEIATSEGWEKVVSIKKVGRKQTYDLQIEGTHNFVGNNIVAHNTFISGNMGIGAAFTTSGVVTPSNGLAIQGNLGVGTTTSNSNLSVSGNAHIGSLYQSIVAPTDGLFVDGNVGIGATTSTNKLDVWGNERVAGTLTVDSTLTAAQGLFGYTSGTALSSGAVAGFNGNVGIGTTSPAYKLDLYSTSSTGLDLRVYNDSLTTGNMAYLSSASNSLTTGSLLALDWSPTASTIGTGDLFSINMGANALGSNLLNLKDNGSSIFSVSQTAVTATIPASFTAPGDVTLSYDLNMVNPTNSFIKSSAPLSIIAGETFNSSNLTLATYNLGNIILDGASGVYMTGNVGIGASFNSAALPAFGLAVAGNVGIGTTTANYNLSVVGTTNITGNLSLGSQLLVPNGTASLPSYSFTNLTNAGLWTNGDGLLLTTGGSNTSGITVTAAGNVGIGTTVPNGKLDVMTGTTGNDMNILFNETASNEQKIIFQEGGLSTFAFHHNGSDSSPNNKFIIQSADGSDGVLDVNALTIQQNGNVGIGTTGPGMKLDVNYSNTTAYSGTANNTPGLRIFNLNNSGGSSQFASITLQASGDNVANNAVAQVVGLQEAAGSTATSLALTVRNSAGNYLEGLRLNSAGNVGIGTTSPIKLFTVGDGATTANATLAIHGPGAGNYNGLSIWTTGVEKWFLGRDGTDSTDDLIFRASAATNVMRIFNSGAVANTLALNAGNVGIGTTSPTSPLFLTSTLATGTVASINANALTTGTGLYVSSTSTAFSSGYLANLDWSPLSTTTATGSLLNIGIGISGSGANYLNFNDNGSSVWSASQTSFTTSLPTSFTAPGDVGIAYDLAFTNQTASYIKSNAPLYLEAGENFESNDLTLRTFGQGMLQFDTSGLSLISSTAAPASTAGNPIVLSAQQGGSSSNGGNVLLNSGSNGSSALNGYIAFGTGGAISNGAFTSGERMRIITNGNVGIGFTSPQSLLHVRSAAGSNNELRLDTGDATTIPYIDFALNGNLKAGIQYRYDSTGLAFQTSGASYPTNTKMFIADGGNVGIGTTSPGAKLDISNTVTGGGALYVKNTDTANPTNAVMVVGNGSLSSQYFRIQQNGNVGIGATTPNYKLDVWGTARATTLSGSGNRALYSDANGQLTNTSSDIRLKTNIEDIPDHLDVLGALDKLRGVYFNWDQSNPDAVHFGTQRELGMIAQEVEQVLPELVGTNANGYKSLNYPQLTGFLVEVAKAQQLEISNINNSIASQSAQLANLNSQIATASAWPRNDIISISSSGNVGIGTTDAGAYKLYVNGSGFLNDTGWTYASDQRLKENIASIGTGLDIINALHPVTFDYINGGKDRAGFIAQEVQQILPALVSQRPDGMLALKTEELIPYTVKAIQEQQNQLSAISYQLSDLNSKFLILNSNLSISEDGTLSVPAIKTGSLILDPSIATASAQLANTSNTSQVGPDSWEVDVNVNNKLAALESRIKSLENVLATNSAALSVIPSAPPRSGKYPWGASEESPTSSDKIATVAALPRNDNTTASSSAALVATSSAQEASSSSLLDNSVTSNEQTSQQANEPTSTLNLTPPDVLLATASAALKDTFQVGSDSWKVSEATVSGLLTAYKLNVQDGFKSLGSTSLGSTTIAGDLTVDGTLTITSNSISSLGDLSNPNDLGILHLQNSPLASALDILNGAFTFDKNGTLTVNGTVLSSQFAVKPNTTAGTAKISAGQLDTIVENSYVDENSVILITVHTPLNQTIAVADKVKGGFLVKMIHSEPVDISFDYLIIGVK